MFHSFTADIIWAKLELCWWPSEVVSTSDKYVECRFLKENCHELVDETDFLQVDTLGHRALLLMHIHEILHHNSHVIIVCECGKFGVTSGGPKIFKKH